MKPTCGLFRPIVEKQWGGGTQCSLGCKQAEVSMKSSYKGKPIIPKLAFKFAAAAYLDVLEQIMEVVSEPDFDSSSRSGKMILELRAHSYVEAQKHLQVFEQTRRGRPSNSQKSLGIIEAAIQESEKRPKRPGRPSEWPIGWDTTVYKTVERERARQVAENLSNGSVHAAVEALLRNRVSRIKGWSERRAVQKYESSLKAAYYRGKRVAEVGS